MIVVIWELGLYLSNILTRFSQEIFSFLELVILAGTALIALFTYFNQKSTEKKHAASIIIMQINSIDENIKKAKKTLGMMDDQFDVLGFWKSEIILESNLWEQYRHLFTKELRHNQIVKLNKYYESALTITAQQKEIKMLISEINKAFYIKTSNLSHNAFEERIRDEEPVIRCASMYLQTMREQCNEIEKIRKDIPYMELKAIAKM